MNTKIIFKSLLLFFLTTAALVAGEKIWQIPSPASSCEVILQLNAQTGALNYTIHRLQPEKQVVLEASALGLVVDGFNYCTRLKLHSKTEITAHTENYSLLCGQQRLNQARFNRCDFTFQTQSGGKFSMHFLVSETGVAFRYAIDARAAQPTAAIYSEETTFNLPDTGKMWAQPYDFVSKWTPAYEAYFENGVAIGTRAPEDKNGVALPVLFQAGDGWSLIAEAGIYEDDCAIHFQPECRDGIYRIRFPETEEADHTCAAIPTVRLPWQSPWRAIVFSNSLNEIFATNLITSLARENQLPQTDWIKPGRASWSWWSDSESPKDFRTLKKFVDFAAEMGWEYSLVDANWNEMQNGNLEKLAAYAKSKNVGLLVWYNSGGPHNTVEEAPRDCMLDPVLRTQTMAWLQQIGVKGIKVDFFQSDKSCIMQQYHAILEDAARYKLLVIFHGCTVPRGWSRTYPNLLSMEAVKGAECYKFDPHFPAAAPALHTIYPFTRNLVGPMDYTPATFTHNTYPHLTTFGHELALSVIFESGVVHFADAVEAYRALPDYVLKFLKNVPVTWDESRLLEGDPGKEVMIARKKDEIWYVAGINGESVPKTFELKPDFIGNEPHHLTLIADGSSNSTFTKLNTTNPAQTIHLLPFGGFVGVITPIKNQ